MKIFAVTLTLLTSISLYASNVYRVTDKEGNVTFTDSPPLNAKVETLHLPKINIASPPPTLAPQTTEGDEAGEDVPYESARIVQPLNNATIPPGQLDVVVQLELKPPLQTGHQVQLYIDGKAQGSPVATSTFTINKLNRGKHKIHTEIIGLDKKRKAKAKAVVIHVKQHSSNS